MSIGALEIGFVLVVVLSIGFQYVLIRSRAYSHFVAAWIHRLSRLSGAPRGRVARLLLPLNTWLLWLLVGALAVPGGTVNSNEDPLGSTAVDVGIGVWLTVFAVLGMLVLVVARTGRPRVLVIEPCRQMSETAAERWVMENLTENPRA